MTSQDITSTGRSATAAKAVIDRMTRALSGRLSLESAAAEVITATGWRRHPGWSTEPSKPEAAADFTYTLVNDLSAARYRLELRGRTYLVPAALDYIEKGDGSAAQMAFSRYSTQWILTYVYAGVRFYFDLQTAPLTPYPAELAPGVKIVLGHSHNTLVVEMPDHTMAVEAPLYDKYTRAALGQVRDAFPGKPLTTVVATHFHYDHIGGIREFAADGGLTLYIGEPAVPFAEAIFTAPHTIDPDRYAARPRPVTVRPVTEPVILPTADGGELRIYRIPSDHADDMVIVYLSGPKIVFESDLWNPTPSMPEPGAQRGRLATQLYQAITDLGLDVETVVSGHRGADGTTLTHTAPLSYLKTAAGL
jgi:glyoxylase-like metal-dependent hydrolase (beta-lactamase superfamily II)